MKTMYSKIPLAQNVVKLCELKGIRNVVITPGSRNAPLTISFANNPFFKAYSMVDERSAAFFALGMAQRLQEPVALCCTSGSALLNYYPAVAEAFYSDIPLVVISADRPVERLDIGDGQTIRQKNVYANHVLYSANLYSEIVLTERSSDQKLQQKKWEAQKRNEREINLAFNTAIEKKGPVHINVPFYEPLYDFTTEKLVNPLEIVPIREKKDIAEDALRPYAKIWNKASKKLILVGVNPPNSMEARYLDYLAKDPSVLVFSETTSNLHEKDFVVRIDNVIAPIEISSHSKELFEQLQPDILLTFGGMVVSKKVKAFLRSYQPQHHWHIDKKKAFDTYFCLNKHFDVTPNTFFERLIPLLRPGVGDYRKTWLKFRDERNERHSAYMQDIPFTDLKAFHLLLNHLTDSRVLHVSNSSVVRYANLFRLSSKLQVYCNRGTSGIDGSVSTAIGSALKSKIPTILISGDLAFFYDSNALWNENIPRDFKIVILNNGGGGIFRILPGRKEEPYFHKFFETRHHLTAEPLCKMYNLGYHRAKDEKTLERTLDSFLKENDRPQILEIFTPTELNDQVLLDYFKYIKRQD